MTAALKITNPADGSALAEVAADDAASVAAKFSRARRAQPAWAATPLAERSAAIRRFRAAVEHELETLARTLTQEVGKPLQQSKNELNGFLGRIDFFLAEVENTVAPETVFADGAMTERIDHDPLGVVANVSAWNYPYFVGGNVFVPALLTGNAVVYKPSEYATRTGLAIVERLHAAGVPAEALVAVVGAGDTGAALVAGPVDAVFFTGSHATGLRVARAAAEHLALVQLELGGKDPIYVCDDVDPKIAAAAVADGAFYNTGQSCCSVERVYVHEAIYAQFLETFVAEVKGYKVGDPLAESTYLGAITRRPQLAVLKRQVADARRKGARLLLGGEQLKKKGNWFAPTVLADVDHSMLLMREESFGPIIGVQAVADDDAAVDLMNDTEYGLTAGVYTPNAKRARRILARVNAGSAYWNCCDRVSPRLPWSGRKHSGIGLTLSTYGIETFTRPKALHLRSG